MTGAAVKASAFQVLLLALLFVFTPSLFHLVLFEVFSFMNFCVPDVCGDHKIKLRCFFNASWRWPFSMCTGTMQGANGKECDNDDYFKQSMVW